MEPLIGVIFPLPKNAIDFMYSNNRDVYVKYTSHHQTGKSRINKGATLYIYQSGGSKSVIGEAIIAKVDFLSMDTILERYSERLMISDDELKQYASGRENKKALVLELEGLKRYKNEIKLSSPLTMTGIYLTSDKKDKLFIKK